MDAAAWIGIGITLIFMYWMFRIMPTVDTVTK